MSIFDWFSSKKLQNILFKPDSKGPGQADATAPRKPSDRLQEMPVSPSLSPAANRKIERLEHREFLYSVVRDAMIRAGILAASYKFKVLSLDGHGLQSLIMLDLSSPTAMANARLAEIEAMIAQAAKMRHDMTVTAVYWRVTEPVAAGRAPSQPANERQPTPNSSERQAPRPLAKPVPPSRQEPAYEPLQEDEVAAFKRALASVTPAAARWASGSTVTSGRRNPAPPADFEDTKRVDSDDRASPLSRTQYGDLN